MSTDTFYRMQIPVDGTIVSVEVMYQMFRERLVSELLVDVHCSPVYGRLVAQIEQATGEKK